MFLMWLIILIRFIRVIRDSWGKDGEERERNFILWRGV